MAKTYYSIEEVLSKLGCTEEQLKGMVREGKLREFRDAGKLSYRVDEVERLSAEASGTLASADDTGELSFEDSGEIPLAPLDSAEGGSGDSDIAMDLSAGSGPLSLEGDSGEFTLEDSGGGTAPLSLEDSGSGSSAGSGSGGALGGSGGGSGSGTGPVDLSGSGGGLGELSLEDSGAPTGELKLDDTDTKSGSTAKGDVVSLDQVDKDAVEGMRKDDTVITNIGISVFDDDDLEIAADPMAKTLMTGGDEHLGLDGSGGGSGLLDLTRESDDTSLGAELLEGIDMGDTAETESPEVSEPSGQEEEEEPPLPEPEAMVAGPAMVSAAVVGMTEAASPAFTGLLVAGVLVLYLLGSACVAMSMGAWPAYMSTLAAQFWALLGGGIAAGGLFALIGFLVDRQASRPKTPKAAKSKENKKSKKAKKGKKDQAPAAD